MNEIKLYLIVKEFFIHFILSRSQSKDYKDPCEEDSEEDSEFGDGDEYNDF